MLRRAFTAWWAKQVVGRDEVARLIAAAPNLKTQTALSVAYSTGPRVSEVVISAGKGRL
jgi:integrase